MSYTRKTWQQTIADLDTTFERWDVDQWATTPQRPPRAKYQSAEERTVTVFWQLRGQHLQLTCNDWPTAQENLRAIYNSIEDLRLIEKRGTAALMRELFKQLPAPDAGAIQPTGQAATADPYAALNVQPGAPLAVAEAAYRTLMRAAHPDTGGSAEQAARLNAAIQAIRKANQ